MLFTRVCGILFAALVSATCRHITTQKGVPEWHPPTADDVRGPCPMMNTLANHGYIPHDGRRITEEVMVYSLGSALNISPALAIALFRGTLPANPQPNATFFSLRDLNRHNLFEHDASLSRNDDYYGDNYTFNQTIFDESRAYWTGPVIDARMIANSKIARQIKSKAFNPTYYYPERIETLALGEMAAPFVTLGDKENVLMDRAIFEYLFVYERLPTELGWKRATEVITIPDVERVVGTIKAAQSLLTVDDVEISTAEGNPM